MKEKIKAIKEYLKYFPNDCYARDNLLLCEYADELGIELKNGYYPRIEYGYFVINSQIKVGKKYHLSNSATKYEQNGNDSIVIWSESCGRLAFVNSDYWWDIEDEWNNFKDVLKSYNPLDYDEINNNYIYDLEHGKQLINDYNEIIRNFRNKLDTAHSYSFCRFCSKSLFYYRKR
jgi:hypothetical protein